MMKLIAIILASTLLLACTSTPKTKDYTKFQRNTDSLPLENAHLTIILKAEQLVDFNGVYSSDRSVSQAGMMYSGSAGGAGFLAQILTHAAVTSSSQQSKLNENQKKANKVLAPFKEELNSFRQSELVHKNPNYQFSQTKESGINVETTPMFYLSQDMKNIVLKLLVSVTSEKQKKPIYQNLVEYVSKDVTDKNKVDYWSKNSSQNLKTTSKELYQASLQLAIKDIKNELSSKSSQTKTYRYYTGEALKIERGALVQSNCKRTTVRNLRGWLISFPVEENNQDVTICDSQPG
ncbi:hypothetical protein [Pleionea sp. CnH1-48]|uniref:hypothetical protein n=1 Tax=Pleionea sp. CnH1-48 TaxID=2954494 RepID=UPI00209843B6|nr:hypothetical protein [Pleionea sp. CnH1-48]MCO7226457.1 hypothetical protein [Pleionea sp. CnH1-48]